MRLILLEGVVISLIGGIFGAVVGSVAAIVLSGYLAGPEAISLFDPRFVGVAIVLAVVMGTLPTIYSARKASRLDPVTALRAM